MVIAATVGLGVLNCNKEMQLNSIYIVPHSCVCDVDHGERGRCIGYSYESWVGCKRKSFNDGIKFRRVQA